MPTKNMPTPVVSPDLESYVRPAMREELTENALTILRQRYLVKDETGNPIETPEEMFWRVALTVAKEDLRYGATPADIQETAAAFFHMMTGRYWLPNSPTLMNAGRPLGQLSACFVLPVADELSNGKDGIYDTLRHMALVHQSGGGTGFSFSRLRPEGSMVRSTTGVASGPVSFMRLYDSSTEVVKQGGTRRGANMGILRVDHPDIRKFISCKSDVTQITNFNISVALTDAFMEALRRGTDYDLVDPLTGQVVGKEDAAEIFDLVVRGAWATGEPGVFFIDRANAYNPVPHMGAYEATNPCGEQPLLPFDVCNLGSINLGRFVRSDVDSSDWRDRVDWEGLRAVTYLSMHFLDNVIDANRFPLPEIRVLANRIRRVGNGVMGFADMLVRLGIGYDTPEGVEVGREVAAFFHEACLAGSEILAEKRDVFPEWERSIWGPDETCARDRDGNRIRPMRRLRNCNVNTVAPTGTISIFANCSGGIEPLFAVAFMRNQAGSLMPDVNQDFVARAKAEGWYSDDLMERIANEGHIHFPEVPEETRRVFVTAHDIAPEWHVRMQAAWQQHTDSAISKTTNFSREATEDDVRKIYLLAYELGCKGVTVYRDGSRPEQVLSTGKTTKPEAQVQAEAEVATLREKLERLEAELAETRHARRAIRKRPQALRGMTRHIASPLGDLYVTINESPNGQPFELFCALGKAGGAAMADAEAMGRLISLILRSGIPITEVHRQLRGISSDKAIGFGPNRVLSVPDAIAQVIEQHIREKEGIQEEIALPGPGSGTPQPTLDLSQAFGNDHLLETCADCGSPALEPSEGCLKCRACGNSRCG